MRSHVRGCWHPDINLQPHLQLQVHENKEPLEICQRLFRSGDTLFAALTAFERLVEVPIKQFWWKR
jgi:hypothetical protein